MTQQSTSVRRMLFTAGPDMATLNEDVVVLTPGNKLGILPGPVRTWGMSAEVLSVGRSTAFHGQARPGNLRMAQSGADEFFTIVFLLDGMAEISGAKGGRLKAAGGEAFYFRSGRETTISWPVKSQFSGAMVPADVLDEFGIGMDVLEGIIDAQEFLSRPAASFLREASSSDAPATALTAYFVERMMHEVVGSVMLSKIGFDSGIAAPATHVHRRAMALMTAQRMDPELTPLTVADQMNVSLRQLQREFQLKGASVATELRRLRTQLAAQLLRDSTYQTLSIEQIARASGFKSGQVMRRALVGFGWDAPNNLRKVPALE